MKSSIKIIIHMYFFKIFLYIFIYLVCENILLCDMLCFLKLVFFLFIFSPGVDISSRYSLKLYQEYLTGWADFEIQVLIWLPFQII